MKLEGYEIVREISRGPINTVYLAIQKALDRPVFLKVLNVHVNDQADLIERFRREAKICARLKHANIVQIFDFGDTDDLFFISMEYIEGKSLVEIVRENHPLPPEIIFFITREIASGLAYAHRFGVIHRDIKPANIMVENDGSIKITDFGLATRADLPTVTAQYSAVGTPAYMSPEQALGEELSVKTDLFSLGVTLYELCTGRSPFEGRNVAESIGKVLNYTPPSLHKVRNDIPLWFSHLVAKLMAKKAEQRPDSVGELLENSHLRRAAVTQEQFARFLQAPQHYAITRTAEEPEEKPKRMNKNLTKRLVLLLVLMGLSAWAFLNLWPALRVTTGQPYAPGIADTLSEKKDTTSGPTRNVKFKDQPKVKKGRSAEKMKKPSVAKAQSPKTIVSPSMVDGKSIAKEGQLLVVCNPWARIYVDGKYMDTTPLTAPLHLPEGEHLIKLANPNFSTEERTVHIRAGKNDTLKVRLIPVEMGLLKIKAVPWGHVFLDGKSVGETPLELSVAAGRHILMIKNPQLKAYIDTVDIGAGQTLERRVALKK